MTVDPDRAAGCLVGLAVGDALGTTLEFRRPGSFEPISDMIGGGPFGLKPGQWTDDTSMALCLAESLLENAWDPSDQMRRYVRWRDLGENSSTGRCFDIGNTVSSALRRFERSGDPFAGSADPHSAGNGSLMRLAPIPLAFHADPDLAERRVAEMSRTTHGARTCVDGCRFATRLMIRLLRGDDKNTALAQAAQTQDLCPEIAEIAAGSYRAKQPPEIRGTGYVVHSLEAALWAFYHSDSFKEGALMAVNLGDDADTTGAIYGQFAGAAIGAFGIPVPWLQRLHQRERIEKLAQKLMLGSPPGV